MIVVAKKAARKPNVDQIKENIVDHFNHRIVAWYENAKRDYGVEGQGEARFNGDMFEVLYVENGERFLATFAICDEYLIDNEIDWLYNIWCEQSTGLVITKLDQ